jgi:hypothetical protein
VLTRRARLPGGTSSARSRSVPTNGRDGGRDTGDEIIDERSVGVLPYENAVHESVAENQLGGIEEHTKDGALGHDNPRHEHDGKFKVETLPGVPAMLQNHQDSDYTLSEERSRRRMDSDRVSETDTIVPRRNLSVLDVAALIFNKMVTIPSITPCAS